MARRSTAEHGRAPSSTARTESLAPTEHGRSPSSTVIAHNAAAGHRGAWLGTLVGDFASVVATLSHAAPQSNCIVYRYHAARATGRRGCGVACRRVYIGKKAMCFACVHCLLQVASAEFTIANACPGEAQKGDAWSLYQWIWLDVRMSGAAAMWTSAARTARPPLGLCIAYDAGVTYTDVATGQAKLMYKASCVASGACP